MRSALLKLLLMLSIGFTASAGTKTWNNASGGNWGTASNWLENAVPGSGDTVYITLDGTYSVTYNLNFASVSAIYLGASSGIQTLINPGNANGVTGTMHINGNGVFQMSSGTYSSSTVINYGTVRLIGGSFTFAPKIVNYDSVYISGTSIFVSGGLSNYDSVFIAAGSFNLNGTDTSYAGKYLISFGATLNFNAGSHTLDANSSISGAGNVSVAATVNVSGTYNITGTTTASNGTLLFNGTAGSLLNIGSTLAMSGGSVQVLTGDSLILGSATLNSTSSTLLVKAPIRFTTSFTMNQGVLRATDSTIKLLIGSGQTLTLNPTSTLRWQKITVENNGTIDWTGGGTATLTVDSGLVINNYGLFDCKIASSPSLDHNQGALSRLNNYGIFRRSVNATNFTVDADIYSYSGSTVDLQTGVTYFYRSLITTDADVTIASGATLYFTGTSAAFDANSSISGAGNVTISSGTATFTGDVNIKGVSYFLSSSSMTFNASAGKLLTLGDSVSIASGTINITSPQSITMRSLRQSGGTLNLTMNDTLVIDTLIQVNGTITGNSPVRIKDWFNWLGGTQSATDSTVATIIQTTALFNSGTHTLSKRTLINRGTISWTLGHWDNNTGAIIRNESGAIIDATAAGYYINYFGTAPAPKFINNGTFRVSSGSSYVYLNVDAINTNASYQIQSGTLQVSASATNVNTSWTLSNNRFAIFAGGTQTWDADSPISGTGTVRFTGGTHTINSVYNISDSTDVATAVTFNGSAPSVGPYLGISGNATFNTKDSLILSRLTMLSSTATFNTNDSVIVDRMVQSGGIMTGNSPIRVKTRYDWSGGYIYGSDSTVTFINSGIVNLTNNTRQVQKRTFINEGTLNWNAAHWDWDYGAIFINHQGALINITGDWYWNNFPNSGSDPMIYNYGTIHKSSGAGQSTINIPLYDSLATYEVASGTLAVQSNHTSKATNFNLSNGARYRIYGSTQYIDTSNTINGSGILDFNGGTAYVASRIPSVDSVTVSGGTVYFNQPDTLQFSVLSITSGGILNGSATVKINTRFAFNSGTLSGTDSTNTLIIGSNAVLNASGLNFFSKRTIDNYGTLNWTSSEWRV
ncbi:MAG TPA: hypothetical protein PKA72_03185, partial [bacterium]|nr:hypothetical protein [bacterium]